MQYVIGATIDKTYAKPSLVGFYRSKDDMLCLDSGDDDILSYCSISFSKKNIESSLTADIEDRGGGAVYCDLSSPTITNCKITNNIADIGGAILCIESYPVI
ncbi:unnamed protein product, partial [marine sediment metagenome]